MTKEDQASIVGNLVLDYQAKKRELACLEAKACNLALLLEQTSKMLREVPEFDVPPQHNPSLLPKAHPSSGDCSSLIIEIFDARVAIEGMRETLEKMGIRLPIA